MKFWLSICTILLAISLIGCSAFSKDKDTTEEGASAAEMLTYGEFRIRWHQDTSRFEIFSKDLVRIGEYYLDLELTDDQNMIAFPANSSGFVTIKPDGTVIFTSEGYHARLGCYPVGALVIAEDSLQLVSDEGELLADFGETKLEFVQSDDNGSFRSGGMYGGPAGYYFEFTGKDGKIWYYYTAAGESGCSADHILYSDENFTVSRDKIGVRLFESDKPSLAGIHYDSFHRLAFYNKAGAREYQNLLIGNTIFHFSGTRSGTLAGSSKNAQVVGDLLLIDGELYDGSLTKLGSVQGKLVEANRLEENWVLGIFENNGTVYTFAHIAEKGFPDAMIGELNVLGEIDRVDTFLVLYDEKELRVRTVRMLSDTKTPAGVYAQSVDAKAEIFAKSDTHEVAGAGVASFLLNKNGEVLLSVIGSITLDENLIVVDERTDGGDIRVLDRKLSVIANGIKSISAHPDGFYLALLDDGTPITIRESGVVSSVTAPGRCLDVCEAGIFVQFDDGVSLVDLDGKVLYSLKMPLDGLNYMIQSGKAGDSMWVFFYHDTVNRDKEGNARVVAFIFDLAKKQCRIDIYSDDYAF